MQNEALFLVDGARTPFGTYMGALRVHTAAHLAIVATKEALKRAGVAPDQVDSVVLGNVMQADRDSYYLAKYVGTSVGMPDTITGMVVNRLCGSGMQAVVSACQAMKLGESEVALVGGTECMSRAPFILRGGRDGLRGDQTLEDPLLGPHSVFTDPACGLIMGETAEELATEYSITREEMDAYALRSQQLAKAAIDRGRLAREIVGVEVPAKGGTTLIDKDEHPRETTIEKLGSLKPVFRKGGAVTPGNASGINDGACTLVVATESQVKALGLKPKAKILSWGVAGVPGKHMGIGPVPAVTIALDRAGLTLDDMAVLEVNEAFAAQYLAVEKAGGYKRDRVNPNGGAIALGHPIGASGARILLSLAYELEERQAQYGVASACIGGGQGIAMVLQRV